MSRLLHYLEYTPMLGALLAVSPQEALLTSFVGARLADIWKVSGIWQDLVTATAGATNNRRGTARFASLAEIEGCYPAPASMNNEKSWAMKENIPGIPNYRHDRVFAALRVAGPNPITLRRVNPTGSALPGVSFGAVNARLGLTDAAFVAGVQHFDAAFAGTLAGSIADGRLFVADYAAVGQLAPGAWPPAARRSAGDPFVPKFASGPIGVFYSHPALRLLPVAINVSGSAADPVVVPSDPAQAWNAARDVLSAADLVDHELRTHLGRTHYVVLHHTQRIRGLLDAQHTVRALLEPHLFAVELNMAVGARLLTNDGGMVPEILAVTGKPGRDCATAAEKATSFRSMNPRLEVGDRGCDDAVKLEYYPYREDAIVIYDAIRAYVGQVLNAAYPTQASFIADNQVRRWLDDLQTLSAAERVGFARATVNDLADVVAGLIFMSSAFHSAVNYAQFDHSMVVPNLPGALYADVAAGNTTPAQRLPPVDADIRQIEVIWLLSSRRFMRLDEVPVLQNHGAAHFAFLQVLDGIRATIAARIAATTSAQEVEGKIPYSYLSPHRIAAAANV